MCLIQRTRPAGVGDGSSEWIPQRGFNRSGGFLAMLAGSASVWMVQTPLAFTLAFALPGSATSGMLVGFGGYILELGNDEIRPLLIAVEETLLLPLYFVPVLGGILTMASASQTAWKGAYLLTAYSLGLGLPFIAVGLALGTALPALRWLRRRSNIIAPLSAILLIAVGILMLTNNLVELYVDL